MKEKKREDTVNKKRGKTKRKERKKLKKRTKSHVNVTATKVSLIVDK